MLNPHDWRPHIPKMPIRGCWVQTDCDPDDKQWIPDYTKACDQKGIEKRSMWEVDPSISESTLLWVNISIWCIYGVGILFCRSSHWKEVETGSLQRNEDGYSSLYPKRVPTTWHYIPGPKEHASWWHPKGPPTLLQSSSWIWAWVIFPVQIVHGTQKKMINCELPWNFQ